MGRPAFQAENLGAKEQFSRFAAEVCQSTYGCCPFITVRDFSSENFRGPRGFRLNVAQFPLLAGAWLATVCDGLGSKVVITNLAGFHRLQARDLLAMLGGDITRWGGCRLGLSEVLDTSTLGEVGSVSWHSFQELMIGLGEVAREQHVVLFDGETAQIGPCVGSVNPSIPTKYNWCGFMVGLYHDDFMILGDTIAPGQIVLALPENGFRANAFTTVQGILASPFGDQWWRGMEPGTKAAIAACAAPAVLYDSFFEAANGWTGKTRIPIRAIAHITGGGIPEKFGALLKPLGLSAVLDDLYKPSAIMQRCFEWGKLTHERAYRYLNGGQGVLVVVDEGTVGNFQSLAREYQQEVKVCGRIVSSNGSPEIRLVSKYQGGDEIVFSLAA